MAIKKLAPRSRKGEIVHFAPEKGLSKLLISLYGKRYAAADYEPTRYDMFGFPVRQVDLCNADRFYRPGQVGGYVHSHILEHIPVPLDGVLERMNAAVLPGGFHVFAVPIRKQKYKEDLSPDLTPDQRQLEFGHPEHMRDFGREDFFEQMRKWFAGWHRLDLAEHLTEAELAAANIPLNVNTDLTGHSVFFFLKNRI